MLILQNISQKDRNAQERIASTPIGIVILKYFTLVDRFPHLSQILEPLLDFIFFYSQKNQNCQSQFSKYNYTGQNFKSLCTTKKCIIFELLNLLKNDSAKNQYSIVLDILLNLSEESENLTITTYIIKYMRFICMKFE